MYVCLLSVSPERLYKRAKFQNYQANVDDFLQIDRRGIRVGSILRIYRSGDIVSERHT